MKGVKHYFKNGTEYKGGTHKMKDGTYSGSKHNKNSAKLFHMKDLSKTVQNKLNNKLKK